MAGDKNAKTASGGGAAASGVLRDGIPMNECEKMIQTSLIDPKVKFLKEQLEKSGCKVGQNFVKGYTCKTAAGGGYLPGTGIVICCNHLLLKDQVTQVLIHELIHAYDDCRAKNLNWNYCSHHACSEIRASHLSGDCHYKRELLRGFVKIRGHEQECVKRRVRQALVTNPNCSEIGAKDAMEGVWDICYNDTKPFDTT